MTRRCVVGAHKPHIKRCGGLWQILSLYGAAYLDCALVSGLAKPNGRWDFVLGQIGISEPHWKELKKIVEPASTNQGVTLEN